MMNSTLTTPKLLSVDEAAKQLGISVWTLRRKCYKGEIASHRIGTRRLMAATELERIIRESEMPRLEVA